MRRTRRKKHGKKNKPTIRYRQPPILLLDLELEREALGLCIVSVPVHRWVRVVRRLHSRFHLDHFRGGCRHVVFGRLQGNATREGPNRAACNDRLQQVACELYSFVCWQAIRWSRHVRPMPDRKLRPTRVGVERVYATVSSEKAQVGTCVFVSLRLLSGARLVLAGYVRRDFFS